VSRLHVLARRPKRTLAALSTALVAVGVTAASGADFTASSANPSNTFSTGTLSINNAKEGSAILTASNMRPGDPATAGTVDIANSGSLSGAFSLSRQAPVDSDTVNPLSGKLNLVVVDCGVFAGATPPVCGDGDDVTKYNGTLAGMTGSQALGTFAASDKHRYKFSVALDSSAGNAYQGDSSSVEFDWAAA
jgi:spore coat-associated protein N